MIHSSRNTTEPVITLPGRIGWRIRYSEIIFDEPPYLVMQATPVFPGCHDKLFERGIVWDVFALIASVRRAGAHQVLNSDCGYAPDSGLDADVLVSHPDAGSVAWELDIPDLRPALDDAFEGDQAGFVRLVFARDQYEADIRALLCDLQHAGCAPVAAEALDAGVHGRDHLLANYPRCDPLRVETLEPDTQGEALERLLEMDAAAPWAREPIWPAGTLVEFGFFPHGDGHRLVRVNGAVSWAWPGRYFPRWEVLTAFKAWLSHVERAFWLGRSARLPEGVKQNEFVLPSEAARSLCHDAGRNLAAVMGASLAEGETAPGVTVRYCECPLLAACSEPLPPEWGEHG